MYAVGTKLKSIHFSSGPIFTVIFSDDKGSVVETATKVRHWWTNDELRKLEEAVPEKWVALWWKDTFKTNIGVSTKFLSSENEAYQYGREQASTDFIKAVRIL